MALEDKKGFIQTRLDSLNEIDNNIVKLLDNIGSVFSTYVEPSTLDLQDLSRTKEKFVAGTKLIYSLLGSIAIGLRKEVKIMDENIGVYDKNDENVMILPISVDQKHTSLGRDRLDKEVKNMEQLVNAEKVGSDDEVHPKVEDQDAMDIVEPRVLESVQVEPTEPEATQPEPEVAQPEPEKKEQSEPKMDSVQEEKTD